MRCFHIPNLFNDSGRKGNDSILGSAGDDSIKGEDGNDTFNGGLGSDTIYGGKNDTLVFSAAGFGGNLTAGIVESQVFTLGTVATTSEHRFIYDAGSGDFFYDSDGIGNREQVEIAHLEDI